VRLDLVDSIRELIPRSFTSAFAAASNFSVLWNAAVARDPNEGNCECVVVKCS